MAVAQRKSVGKKNNGYADAVVLNSISRLLRAKKQTLSVAESVTSGYLQTAFSQCEQAMHFFQGGITVYNIDQKKRLLQVEPIDAISCNGVSQQIAETMARQVCALFLSDYGIGITGYATPVPDRDVQQPFSYFSIAQKQTIIYSGRLTSAIQPALKVQHLYTKQVLTAFLQKLQQ